ncbi:pentapeptide repeat-containing protein [Oceanicaulis sp. MMSF_3324]|uniref:pentapeptide repeat-containing protein n=1 Tax=Oceanicaulis sp. MMSF_3324 TaxID=3046702 RepID=UPI00273D16B5|nr:pentapeptide repeat-containing protein [Oceanicaulis sp. MMSF_3324]
MLKQVSALLVLALMLGGPAFAQNASEIERVRAGQSCPGCNLFQADLSYLDLPDIDVSGARLRQADLSLATMNRANFTRTNLSIANLFGARFTSASFVHADLSRSTAVGAYFGSADMTGARLEGANLSGAEMATARGLTQSQLNLACGDESTQLPAGLTIPRCR